jgi:polygalacturonase
MNVVVKREMKMETETGMDVNVVMHTARSAVLEIKDGGRYFSKEMFEIRLNGQVYGVTERTVASLFGLLPGTEYTAEVYRCRDGAGIGDKVGETQFETDGEFVTLDVKAFGAKGDGVQDDTHFIQAAIMACPEGSRVLIPVGIYRITNLFLKSHLRLELAKDAELRADTKREKFALYPGLIQSYDETDEYNLGTWEGNPLPMFAGIICGINVEDVVIYGEGVINGNASHKDWWENPKVMRGAFRPRLFFISHCRDITLQGVKFCNSPSWTLHPYFSVNLRFLGITVENPADSPNTDGLDPESCTHVEVLGVRFSLGDDCIAVKSGKIYMGRKHKTPSSYIEIRQCLMENGHGAVTLGSEMSGGVHHLTVEDCIFRHTDRGLRIKTRRGRGKDAVLDEIVFKNLTLDHVMTPLVINSFYFCDPDGKTPYVQSRELYPVDERTPVIKKLVFENMNCTNVHVAAAYFDGLPEQKIQDIVMRNVSFSYAEHPKCDVPAMSEGVEPCSLKGIFARNIDRLVLDNVEVIGQEGETIVMEGVNQTQVDTSVREP